MKYSIVVVPVVILCQICGIFGATVMDCQRPPQLVDPSTCCQDGGRHDVAEKCAKRLGLGGGEGLTGPPSVEAATCLAECILTESKYMQAPQTISLEAIRSDLMAHYGNDTLYVNTMVSSFERCLPSSLQKLVAFHQMPIAKQHMQSGCSPFAGMLLGCSYMEYFKNCPADRWNNNAECRLAQQFVKQCSLGA